MSLPTPGQPTAAQIGKGTTWAYATNYSAGTNAQQNSTGTFTIAAELLDLKMPKRTASPITVQRYDSPTTDEELIAGWSKGGDCETSFTYNDAQGAAIYALFNIIWAFQVMKPNGKGWTYVGIITEFGDEVPLKDKMMNTAKLQISGAPFPTAASA